jgi:capsular polysaccharide transport system permease protein
MGAGVFERQGSLSISMRLQLRVVGALMMREIITRYGRHNLGFLWLLAEPTIFTIGVAVIWNITHISTTLKVEITPFIVTGYSALLLWRNCTSRGINAIEPNRSLLHHRQVKIIDIFIARMALELAGVTAAFIILMASMTALNLMPPPKNLPLMTLGWVMMSWFSACLGTILGCLSEYSELVERFWHPISYFLLTGSGTFFMVEWLPTKVQTIALMIPMVHPIEMMRSGYWGNSVRAHYEIGYITFICLAMSLVSLIMLSDRRLKASH